MGKQCLGAASREQAKVGWFVEGSGSKCAAPELCEVMDAGADRHPDLLNRNFLSHNSGRV